MDVDDYLAGFSSDRPKRRTRPAPRDERSRMAGTAGRDLDAINAARRMRGLPELIAGVPDAEQAAARTARAAAEKHADTPTEWPDDFPRPRAGHPYPPVPRIAEWLGLELRRFDAPEVAKLTRRWAKEAIARGLIEPPGGGAA